MDNFKPLTTNIEIYKKIESLYRDKNKFIIHIIRSNFPMKTRRVISFINEKLYNRRCCLSDMKLIDLYQISKQISNRDKKVSYESIIQILSDIRTPVNIVNREIEDDRTLALIGEKSDKMLSLKAHNQLMLFLCNEFNNDNLQIKNVLYQEFVRKYKIDVSKRFDLNIPYYKLSENIKENFNVYVLERFVTNVNKIDDNILWNLLSNRNTFK